MQIGHGYAAWTWTRTPGMDLDMGLIQKWSMFGMVSSQRISVIDVVVVYQDLGSEQGRQVIFRYKLIYIYKYFPSIFTVSSPVQAL